MADTKISALGAAGTLDGTEVVPIVQAAATVKATLSAIAGLAAVSSVFGRTGAVTLTSADVTGALTYTPLRPSNNLSDLSNAGTARTNLGLGSAAVLASSAVLQSANNLSDLAAVATARTNLGLVASATTDTTNATNITSGTLPAAQLPGTAVQTTGSYANPSWITSLANAKVTGLAASATTDTTNAANITSGTLPFARYGANAAILSPADHGLLDWNWPPYSGEASGLAANTGQVWFTRFKATTTGTRSNIVLQLTTLGATLTAANTGSITGAANNGSGAIRITSTAHGRSTNDIVTIAGVVGTTEANGAWKITVVDANNFDLVGSTFTNTYTSGGTWTRSVNCVGLYDQAGNFLSATGDLVSTMTGTTGTKACALATPISLTAGNIYHACWVFTGTTPPSFARVRAAVGAMNNVNLSSSTGYNAATVTGTALPGSISLASASVAGNWWFVGTS